MIYCVKCWCKNIDECDCSGNYNGEYPYFCGNCNGHVMGIEASKVEPIIKLMKKNKIPIPEGMAEYSWKR